MQRTKGKAIVITGAASGIGAYTAGLLASEGAMVMLADIDKEGAERQAQVIRDKDGDARAIHLDLVSEDSIRNMTESTAKTFGRLDVLVNNAAATQMAQARDGAIEAMDAALWDLTMQINLRGPMLAIKHAVPHFNAAGGGSIINLSSGGGLSGATAPTPTEFRRPA